jgi:hypothetical protein
MIDCVGTSINGAMCFPIDNQPTWVYNGDFIGNAIIVEPPLTVLGNVEVDVLSIGSSLTIHGCLLRPTTEIIPFPGREIRITQNPGCKWPNLTLNAEYWTYPVEDTSSSRCEETYLSANEVSISTSSEVTIISTPVASCQRPLSKNDVFLVLITVIPAVGAVAIFLGVYFGIKKYRKKNLAFTDI